MRITIDIEDEPKPEDRETNLQMMRKMLDAQNLLEHERKVLREERNWLEDAWIATTHPGPPECASEWAIAERERIMRSRGMG